MRRATRAARVGGVLRTATELELRGSHTQRRRECGAILYPADPWQQPGRPKFTKRILFSLGVHLYHRGATHVGSRNLPHRACNTVRRVQVAAQREAPPPHTHAIRAKIGAARGQWPRPRAPAAASATASPYLPPVAASLQPAAHGVRHRRRVAAQDGQHAAQATCAHGKRGSAGCGCGRTALNTRERQQE